LWYPEAKRARAIEAFMKAVPISALIGGPLSGALLGLNGGAIIAKQQKQIEALATGLQKVSAQLETSKPAPQMVGNNQ
jgi:MFS transporter, ACS family, tartrate transporter